MQDATTPPPVQTAPTTPGIAVTSLVLGILGLTCIGPLGSIPAIICGHKAQGKIKRSGGALGGAGMAIAGYITGYVGIGLALLMLPLYLAIMIPAMATARDAAREAACTAKLSQIEMVKEMWALEKNRSAEGTVIPEGELNEYMEGIDTLTCPAGGTYSINPVGIAPACSVHDGQDDSMIVSPPQMDDPFEFEPELVE